MKAVIKKIGEVTMSVLLIALICVPIPAMSALAEEADGEDAGQAEQAQAQADESEESNESIPASESTSTSTDISKASVDTSDTSTTENTTDANEAATDTDNTDTTDTTGATENTDATDADEETDPNTFKVSTTEELETAFATINADATNSDFTITLDGDVNLSTSETVSAGKTVTLEGNGHSITLDSAAILGVNGTGATLNLNGALTIQASASHTGTMITAQNGTLNMNSGVTIEGNGDSSAVEGGGVSVTDKATFNMNGGTIENCNAHTGGGVYVCAATFNMSGNSVIQNCNANVSGTSINGDGGGVFLNVDRRAGATTMNMSGNATIRNCHANSLGGGVFLETATTLTMSGNASVVQNSADAGGGVMNYGMATLTTVYNNTANNGAADIFNNGRMKLGPTNPDWVLLSTGTHVTGWYVDTYHSWDGTETPESDIHRWTPEADDNVEYTPTDSVTSEVLTLIAGAPLPTVDVIWENEDGSVLYEMDKVRTNAIPAADEYTTLSGHEDPSEPDTTEGLVHEFTGWTETQPSDDEIVYIANYKLVAPAAHTHTVTVHFVDEHGNKLAPDYTETLAEGTGYDVHSPHIDGYTADTDEVTGTVADSDIEQTVFYHSGTSANTITTGSELQQTGDDTIYALAGLLGLVSASAFFLGVSLLMRKRMDQ